MINELHANWFKNKGSNLFFRGKRNQRGSENDEDFQWEYFGSDINDTEEKEEIVVDEAIGAEVLNEDDKLFIFTTGTRTHVPHQIGIKLMSKIKFKKKLNIPKDIKAFFKEHDEARRRAREDLVGRHDVEVTPWNDYKAIL